MDREELMFKEYEMYAKQKENFIDRNFRTNKFYMIATFFILVAMIFTGNIVFIEKISATLVFGIMGIMICALWWMNVDTYNTLIKIKYANVIERIEANFPVKPFTEEFAVVKEYRNKKVFLFSDMQKLVAALGALFYFAVTITEINPLIQFIVKKAVGFIAKFKCGL